VEFVSTVALLYICIESSAFFDISCVRDNQVLDWAYLNLIQGCYNDFPKDALLCSEFMKNLYLGYFIFFAIMIGSVIAVILSISVSNSPTERSEKYRKYLFCMNAINAVIWIVSGILTGFYACKCSTPSSLFRACNAFWSLYVGSAYLLLKSSSELSTSEPIKPIDASVECVIASIEKHE
jgi:hypothetical protein